MKFAIFIVFFSTIVVPCSHAEALLRAYVDNHGNVHVVSAEGEDAAVTADGRAAHVILAPNKQSAVWLVKEYLRPDEATGAGVSMFGVYHGGGVGFVDCEKRIRQIGFRQDGENIAVVCGNAGGAGIQKLYEVLTLEVADSFDESKRPSKDRPEWARTSNEHHDEMVAATAELSLPKDKRLAAGPLLPVLGIVHSTEAKQIYIDQLSNVHVITASGQDVRISAERNATEAKLSPDRTTAVWLVKELVSGNYGLQLAPFSMRLYRNGQIREIGCGLIIRRYWFVKRGTRLAIDCGGWHGAGREILYDLSTLQIVEEFDQFEVPTPDRPAWSSSDDESGQDE